MTFSVFLSTTWPGIARAERNGNDWLVEQVSDVDARCLAVDGASGEVVAGTHGNGVWRSSDGGRTWGRAGLEGSIVKSLATTPAQPGLVVAGTKPTMIWISEDGGSTWAELSAFADIPGRSLWRQPAERPSTAYVQALAVSPTDPDVIVAGIEAGAVVRTNDRGRTWSGHRKGACRDCHSLTFHARDGNHVYEGGGGLMHHGVAVSRDAGETWSRPPDGLDRKYGWAVAADPLRPEVCYVSLSPGAMKAHGNRSAEAMIFRTVGLEGWEALSGGLPTPLTSMPYALLTSPGSPGHIDAGLADGDIWHSEDLGDTWRQLQVKMPGIYRSLVGYQ